MATPRTAQPAPEDRLCFSLYRAQRAFESLCRTLLKEVGLTFPQYLVLSVLWDRGEASIKQIGGLLLLDSGTLSPLVRRLEVVGLVRRTRSAVDERSVIVQLTEQGRGLRDRVEGFTDAVGQATGLSAVQAQSLAGTLDALVDALEASGRA